MHRRVASLAAFALLAACATGGAAPVSAPSGSPGISTVAQALKEAGVPLPDGQLLALRTHRALGPDKHTGRVLVNGVPSTASSPVPPGAVITVEGGGDVTEKAETVTLLVPANHGYASLRTGAQPGRVRVVRGVVSH